VFIYPDDVWYTRVTREDVPEIAELHLAEERLQASGYGYQQGSGRSL
jgi:(2Fe-2S) ferredoxin